MPTNDRFTLSIDLGNDAMQTTRDVARALRKVADRLADLSDGRDTGRIMDDNGNTVGEWSFT